MKTTLILVSLLLLAGCDYDAPLTEQPTRQMDPALVGSWFSLTNGVSLDIYRLSANEFLAMLEGNQPFVCTHSDLGGVNFVSCRNIGHDEKSYGKYSYRAYKLEGEQIILWDLSQDLGDMKGLTAAQRRARIEEAVKNGKALDTVDHIIHYKRKP